MNRYFAFIRNSFNAPQRVEIRASTLFEATEIARATYGDRFMGPGYVGLINN
jgi:hypothetical protein